MRYPEYKPDLHRIYQSEVYGAHVFKMAGRLTFSEKKKEKWMLLWRLETLTPQRFLRHIEQTGQKENYPYVWSVKGYVEGFVLGLLPWTGAMYLLAKETRHFLKIWKRLAANSLLSERSFFDYVYAHEKAIQVFAISELQKNENSTVPVQALLSLDKKEDLPGL